MRWRLAALFNGLRDHTAYRAEFLIDVLSSAIVPAAIQWLLWYSIFSDQRTTTVAGYGYSDFVLYTLVSMLFSQVRGGNLDFEIQEMIRSGQLSNYLLRPVGVVEFVYIRGLAPRLIVVAAAVVLGTLGSFWAPENTLTVPRLFLGLGVALWGNVIHYLFSAAVASVAFYWEEAHSVLMIKNMLVGLLSGEAIPLLLVPESYSWVWKATPFYLYVYAPVQLATGRWSAADLPVHILAAALWTLVGLVLVRFTWQLGMRRYLSIGG